MAGVGEKQAVLGPGERHVGQAALLVHLGGFVVAAGVGEELFLEADEDHDAEFEALGRMGGEQRDRVAAGGQVVDVGNQRGFAEVSGQAFSGAEAVVLGGGGLKLDYVLPAFLGAIGVVVEDIVVAGFADDGVDEAADRHLVGQGVQAAQ